MRFQNKEDKLEIAKDSGAKKNITKNDNQNTPRAREQ